MIKLGPEGLFKDGCTILICDESSFLKVRRSDKNFHTVYNMRQMDASDGNIISLDVVDSSGNTNDFNDVIEAISKVFWKGYFWIYR